MNGSFWNFSLKYRVGFVGFLFFFGSLGNAGAESDPRLSLVLMLAKSLESYASVNDYTARFLKQERSEGKMDPAEEIFLKFEKPFKIYMKWLNPPKKGLEVHYERGKHEGKLAIHKPGFLTGLAGVIFLDQKSPWVRKGSESYDIEDAGIGTFLSDFNEAVQDAFKTNRLNVQLVTGGPVKADTTWDITFEVPSEDDIFFAKRCVVQFDLQSNLPVHMELFDWEGHRTGIYDYQDLKLNLGNLDPQFKNHINRRLLRVYSSNT